MQKNFQIICEALLKMHTVHTQDVSFSRRNQGSVLNFSVWRQMSPFFEHMLCVWAQLLQDPFLILILSWTNDVWNWHTCYLRSLLLSLDSALYLHQKIRPDLSFKIKQETSFWETRIAQYILQCFQNCNSSWQEKLLSRPSSALSVEITPIKTSLRI